jgi:uncharacterized coiled-coil protein SlyX
VQTDIDSAFIFVLPSDLMEMRTLLEEYESRCAGYEQTIDELCEELAQHMAASEDRAREVAETQKRRKVTFVAERWEAEWKIMEPRLPAGLAWPS